MTKKSTKSRQSW